MQNNSQDLQGPHPNSQGRIPYERFPRMELLLVLILTLVTMGTYTYYWLFTRTQILNQLIPEKPISNVFVSLCIAGFIVLLFTLFSVPEASSIEELQELGVYNKVAGMIMVLNGLLLAWGLLFCQRLNMLSQKENRDALYANYLYLILAHLLIVNTLYLQYKINQLIDSQRIGLM